MGVLRTSRPERIVTETETYERNDICAARFGSTERAIDNGDKHGAPFVIMHGIKYRPVGRYDKYVESRIVQKRPPRRRR